MSILAVTILSLLIISSIEALRDTSYSPDGEPSGKVKRLRDLWEKGVKAAASTVPGGTAASTTSVTLATSSTPVTTPATTETATTTNERIQITTTDTLVTSYAAASSSEQALLPQDAMCLPWRTGPPMPWSYEGCGAPGFKSGCGKFSPCPQSCPQTAAGVELCIKKEATCKPNALATQSDKLTLSYELANGLWSKLLSVKNNWQADLTSVLSDWKRLQSLIACQQEDPFQATSGWMNSTGLFQKVLKAFVYSGSPLLQRKAWLPYQAEPWAGRRLVIVGAGPVGLRMAIEALLLGAEVDVVEARNTFSRVNVLKMWSFASADLASLGLKDLGLMFSQAYDKVNINLLQHALSRLLLVLGGRLHVSKLAGELRASEDGRWWLPIVDSNTNQEVSTLPFDALVDATGKVAAVSKRPVCGRKVFDFPVKNYASGGIHQRRAAITANWHRFPGDMGKQFHADYDAVAAKMSEYQKDVDSRVRVTDLVTFQSPLSNYMVMSVLIDELEKLGVFKSTEKRHDVYALLDAQNVDRSKLADVVEMVAEDWRIPHGGEAGMLTGINKMSIFEFMDMQYSADPLDNEVTMVQALPDAGSCSDLRQESANVKPQFMLTVGDTLWAPFWPEGTGMSRGILSVNHAGFALTRLWQSVLTGQQLRETLKWANRWGRAGVFATSTDCAHDQCSPGSVRGYAEAGYAGAEPQSFHSAMDSFVNQ